MRMKRLYCLFATINGNPRAQRMKSIKMPTVMTVALVAITTFSTNTFSRSNSVVNASDIMEDIKQGKDIVYENVTIAGKLDFTYMDEKMPGLPELRVWRFDNDDNVVNEVIENRVSFVNVTFEADVVAYFHEDQSGYTFTANFENDVNFQNCKFEGGALFKYSEFESDVSFEESTFLDTTTFKYAEFELKANFEASVFEKNATFKYAKFRNGVSFDHVNFARSLDLKYTSVQGDFGIQSMYVGSHMDTKYTDINGRGFSKSMMK